MYGIWKVRCMLSLMRNSTEIAVVVRLSIGLAFAFSRVISYHPFFF